MNRRILYIATCLMLLPVAMYAQEERKHVRRGNKIYDNGDYEKAQIEYQTAKELNGDSFEATFNLGDAFFKKEKYDEALNQFKELTERENLTPEQAGAAWYNLGNAYMATQKLDEAIEAYKNSLRARPDSMDAKYNLEYAKSMKQDQENQQNQDQNQNQNQDQQNQDQNKDQNKDQQNQDNKDNQDQNNQEDQDKNQNQNQDNQDQNDQQNQDKQDQQDKQNQQNQDQNQDNQQQNSESKISKEDAERLLEALSADEQEVRDKVEKEKVQAMKAKQMKIEKDW